MSIDLKQILPSDFLVEEITSLIVDEYEVDVQQKKLISVNMALSFKGKCSRQDEDSKQRVAVFHYLKKVVEFSCVDFSQSGNQSRVKIKKAFGYRKDEYFLFYQTNDNVEEYNDQVVVIQMQKDTKKLQPFNF